MSTSDNDLTTDDFLSGRLTLRQPRRGYRAGVDPILLASSVPARAGQSVLDLGCGVGAAMLALGRRVDGLELVGIELQADYAELARENARLNRFDARIVTGDVINPPSELKAQRFDHVISNPPYFAAGDGTAAADAGRETALRETAPLDAWIDAGSRRLLPRGTMSVIQRTDRLPALLGAMAPRLGSLHIRPLQPRARETAHLVIVHGVKGGRGRAVLDPSILVHDINSGGGSDGGYTSRIREVLRNGAFIDDFPDD